MLSIAKYGFNPAYRNGQVFGPGEYFAKNPAVALSFSNGSPYLLYCKLVLGSRVFHDYVHHKQFYIVRQRDCYVQALPLYLLKVGGGFDDSYMIKRLKPSKSDPSEKIMNQLSKIQRGGTEACIGRISNTMVSTSTKKLFCGWLHPSLLTSSKQEFNEVLKNHFNDVDIKRITRHRNSTRIGAFISLRNPISQLKMAELNKRLFVCKGSSSFISVADAQLGTRWNRNFPCPRLTGVAKFCRGRNLRSDWRTSCDFKHFDVSNKLHGYDLEVVSLTEAKTDELSDILELQGVGSLSSCFKVHSSRLKQFYDQQLQYLQQKHGGSCLELELWFATDIPHEHILSYGIPCPSDYKLSDKCDGFGVKDGFTWCDNTCIHCTVPYTKDEREELFPYGAGIYLTDYADSARCRVKGGAKYLYRCKVALGTPYKIDPSLIRKTLSTITHAEDPTDRMAAGSASWDHVKQHDSYSVPKYGQFIVFNSHSVLPLYVVELDNSVLDCDL